VLFAREAVASVEVVMPLETVMAVLMTAMTFTECDSDSGSRCARIDSSCVDNDGDFLVVYLIMIAVILLRVVVLVFFFFFFF